MIYTELPELLAENAPNKWTCGNFAACAPVKDVVDSGILVEPLPAVISHCSIEYPYHRIKYNAANVVS